MPIISNQVARMHGVPYIQAIGSVLWSVVVSDAAYAMGVMSQFMQNLGPAHWEGLKQIINYLRSMKDLWLTFGGHKETMVEGFCDVDWASQKHRHSISGFSFHFGVRAISWSSKKQGVVLLSSTEVEYIVQTHAAKEGIWLRRKFKEEKKNRSPSHATIREPLCWQRTTNSMQGRSTSTYDIISSMRQSKTAKFK